MIPPLIAFAGLTVAALIKQIILDSTANMAKKSLARSYLVKRIDTKLEKKYGKNFLKEKLSDVNMEGVREIVHEELSAYLPRKVDVDQLIVNSIQTLSDDHQVILDKLDNVETLLEKISIPLAFRISKSNLEEDDIPESLLTGLLEGAIVGKEESQLVLKELTEDQVISKEAAKAIESVKFIQRINRVADTEISRLVRRFTHTPEEINSLNTLMEISALLTGSNKQLEDVVSEFVFKLISDGLNTKTIEDAVVSFSFLVHRLGKLNNLSRSDQILLGTFLRRGVQQVDDPTRMIESYFLLTQLNQAGDIDPQFVIEVLEAHQKRGVNTTREMAGQLRVTGKIARFIRRLGLRKTKPEASLRTISILIKKLDKRKFVRTTKLLKYQLERLTSEMNLMSAYFDSEIRTEPSQENLDGIIELLQILFEILSRKEVYQLDIPTLRLVVELLDSSYYLYDLLAVRNSWALLTKYQLNVRSIYSPTLERYKKITPDETKLNIALHEFSRKRIVEAEQELPSPPRQTVKKRIKG
ncbi:MAG: hypothetical protein ACFFE8_04665 [Candidatus Heimdallarchaeota archaeon]